MAPVVPTAYTGQKESKNFSHKMIGKSRSFSMGNHRGLVSDYRHAVELTAESEGFGSSGRVDTEMTISEDSCSPKRKCISLNGDNHDQFGYPKQVHSFSKMSRSERKDLTIRLKRELEDVQLLQRKVSSFSTSAVVLSPASDIRSCSDGQKRPPLENTPRPPPVHPVKGKKQPPGSAGRNGARMNKKLPGQIDTKKQVASVNASNPMLMKRCETLLNWLMEHQYSWVFNEPVDVVKLNIPDYFNVIKHPMDFSTVKNKLSRGEYTSPLGFAADVRLTFSNAMTYNPPGNDVHFMAQTLSKHFEQRWKVIQKKMSTSTDFQVLPSPVQPPARNEPVIVANHIPPSKKKKVAPVVGHTVKSEPIKRVMIDSEKHKLSTELEALLSELPDCIIEFLKESSSGAGENGEEEIEIDIFTLGDDVLFKLRKLLDDFLLEKKNQTKAEPCEMELNNESGFSNSSIQAAKGNDAVDEDVDIGGNDHPISSFPPVEIDKDTVNKSNRGGSPSSSSSDSGSSSSDSESGSSSSESEGARALPPANKLQSTLDGKPNVDQMHNDLGQDVGRNTSRSSLSQVDQSSQTKPLLIEVDGHKDGESAPSEKQVSPDKLYRAALLRSRFADTILKAQEKTLEKVETRDPEKLRLEREELERRQREEKARLQAEAKAAEEAQRKAAAEAAAEAKRKRELEREAARLALQQMEKTVDINEDCRFMADLELLSSTPADNLTTFTTSPNNSQNGGMGSFRFRGNSNPLEQLGLYMKNDDEDEDEVDAPHNPPDSAPDVEEGEID
ncbi:unnamed protein product [Amaranthus hypochondriacus]